MPGENIQDWSTTALTNSSADSSINWAEGQARASVNNSARSMMAAHAKKRNYENGSIVTTGSANVQAFLSGMSFSSVPTNMRVLLKIGSGLTNTGAVTLNMDSIGAVAVVDQFSAALTAGMLKENSYAEFVYNAGAASWVLINVRPGLQTNIRKFTASSTYPTTTATVQVMVYCKGGGGGGAGAALAGPRGGGGGEGAESWLLTTAAALSAQTVTIGAGGAAGVDGVTGGTTSVGALCTAPGGAGGTRGDNGGSGGAGGAGGTNTWGMPGAPGQSGSDVNGALAFHAAGGGQGAGITGTAGVANSGGGGGNGSNSSAGGAGGSGVVICYEYGTI